MCDKIGQRVGGGLTSLRSETGVQVGHKLAGGCLHLYSLCSIQIGCATIPADISSDTAAEHPSLWHPPSQCHASPVRHAPPPLTVQGVHSLKPVFVPSAVGPMFCLSGLHAPWGSHCRGSCRLLLPSSGKGRSLIN